MYKTSIAAVAALMILQAGPAMANKPKAPTKPASEKTLIELKKAVEKIKLKEIDLRSRPASP